MMMVMVCRFSGCLSTDSGESDDNDGDGIGDNADADDGDGVDDSADAFPFDATETLDTDGDGVVTTQIRMTMVMAWRILKMHSHSTMERVSTPTEMVWRQCRF